MVQPVPAPDILDSRTTGDSVGDPLAAGRQREGPMIVFALRHADRTPEPQDELKPKGVARAKLLARMLAESGVSTAFCSSAKRTQLTVQPLKDLLLERLTIVKVSTASATHVQDIVDGLMALPDDAVAMVVGHSDTVPEVIKKLTGKAVDEIKAGEFDKLFVLS